MKTLLDINLMLFAEKKDDLVEVQNYRDVPITTVSGSTTTYKASDYLSKDKDLDEVPALANVEAAKPAAYQGKYDDQIQSILNDILNKGDFSYDFNADPLYHQYAENYTNKGKLAMMDTLGQAASLTGGYGNTYANQAAQQTYNGYMQDLSNQIPNLYSLAEDTWQNNLSNQRSNLSTLQGLDSTDYSRYRDTYGDWENDRNYAYTKLRDAIGDLQYKAQYYAAHPELDPNGTKEKHYWSQRTALYNIANYMSNDGSIHVPVIDENGKTMGKIYTQDSATNAVNTGELVARQDNNGVVYYFDSDEAAKKYFGN